MADLDSALGVTTPYGLIGTALLAVVLEQSIAAHAGRKARLVAHSSSSPPAGADLAVHLATAFQHTFWVATGLIGLTVVAAFFLPGSPPAPEPHPAAGQDSTPDGR